MFGLDDLAAATLGSGVIGGVGSVLGTIFGASSNASANETNLQIAREQNQLNRDLFKEQQAFSLDMWNKQNEYNTPANQAARLKEAGINPLVLGSGVTSQAGSVNIPSPQPAVGATVRPYDYQTGFSEIADSVGRSVNAYYQNRLLDSQVREKDVDTGIKKVNLQFAAMEKIQSLLQMKADCVHKLSSARLSDTQRDYYQSLKEQIDGNIKLFRDTYEDLKNREHLQNDLMNEQTNSIRQDVILKKIEASYKPALLNAGIRLSNAQATSLLENLKTLAPQIELLYSQGKLANSRALGQFILNRMNSIDADNKAMLQGLYNNKNAPHMKYLQKFSYALGDLLFGQLRGVLGLLK